MGLFSKAQPAEIAVSENHEKSEDNVRDTEPMDATGNRLNREKVQSGVARIEATTKIWSKSHLITAHVIFQGVSYCVTIFIADTSSLLNRPLMLAFATSPYIVTTWVGGPVTESALAGPGWRWGFGIWTIITPVVILPLSVLFLYNDGKAVKAGLIEKRTGWITVRDVWDYIVAMALVGILLLAGGMALFLLPFGIWSYQAEQWRAPLIIACCFIPYELLLDRTVFSAGVSFIFIYAGAIIAGLIVHKIGKFKWVSTYYALPLTILEVGLMIKFRQASEDIGYVIMTQIFVAFAGGPMVVAGEMAMMVPSDHQHVAVIMAMLNLFCSIGSAVGSTIS
ncbi:hypothetical protein MAC_07372 [Metarhizium acridum CQMa 102]|uniref:Siderophore iron transporter n=2 Tax=Metarhizium acridum TaxID=92637 RepID=E9EBX4_METAQ|nr:uncharacterized protein MAC_07372 [Metarhizium acridum CQMa 102]EFY86594.1 hypothetical protein MAC_07372 [Metarhizium acridum CQMa 102]